VIRLIAWLIDVGTAAFTLVVTLSFAWGLVRFLVAAPGAIRRDLEDARSRRRPEPEAAPEGRVVPNEATPPALPAPRPQLPAAGQTDDATGRG
jgi:hypothetical protein